MCVARRGTQASYTYTQTQEPVRPRLPRGLSTSARINLNHYWSVLEDLVTCSCPVTSPELSNVLNENRANEMSVMERFVPVSPQGEDESSRTRVLGATRRNLWGVLVHSAPSKRKTTSVSIKQIVKKLAK